MSALTLAFVAVYAVAAAIMLWSLMRLNAFLAATPQIGDEAALERFKALARAQMHLALVMIAVLIMGGAVSFALMRRDGLSGSVLVILINAVAGALGMYHTKVEKRTRSLPASPALADTYRRIGEHWVAKALPDF